LIRLQSRNHYQQNDTNWQKFFLAMKRIQAENNTLISNAAIKFESGNLNTLRIF